MSKQIDDIFKKEFKDYSLSVPDSVWENIEQSLNQNKKQSVFSMYKLLAAASILIVAVLTLFFTFQNTNRNTISEKIVSQSTTPELKNKNKSDQISQNKIEPNKEIENSSKYKNNTNIESTKEINHIDLTEQDQNIVENTIRFEKIEKLSAKEVQVQSNFIARTVKLSNPVTFPKEDKDLIADNLTGKKTREPVKWIIGGEFAPTYSYRYLSAAESNLEKSYYNSVEAPISSYSGGVNVKIVLHKRLSVQTGVYYSSMGQSINHLNVYSNNAIDKVDPEYRKDFENTFTLSNSIGNIKFNSMYVFVDETNFRIDINSENKYFFDATDPIFNELEAEISQNIEYLEIPLYLNYKFIDRKIDLNITGGIGANMLISNNVYLIHGNSKENIGETDGVNTMNYSGTFALGIELPILRNLTFNLQPAVKYYINAINPDSDIESHPYSFAVYSGFNYSF
ncbi:MAG: hypothetical protein A2041_08485 [Bacteroidetes bacterium GWA2_31_9b]|nr:MAG: hypothetical protein A2041_08485 [Bacteroidetes bacterium GWA2_31_9b]